MRIAPALLEEAFTAFRACGQGRRECVGYYTGPLAEPELADAFVHPEHGAGRGGYEIDRRWLTRFWLDLYREQRAIRMQLHTHPRQAFHSQTDDEFPAVHTPGFLSLVIPDFAEGEATLERCALYELDEHGDWRRCEPVERLELAR